MLTFIRNGEVYTPDSLGRKDILIAGERIAAVLEPGEGRLTGLPVKEIDASELVVAPGLLDPHVHILGGGGEGGPTTRAPEITLDKIIASGVTTIIACLGTDGITRHMTSLLAKARALEKEGITTYVFSGSYEIPVQTLTGSVRSDLVIIDKVVGAGEIAVSDHRSSQPSFPEFARLAAECRVGGMLGGKPGILHCHLGDGARRLEMLFRLIDETEIPPTQIIPTHANRNPELLEEAFRFIQRGGFIDLTADLDPDPKDEGHLSIAACLRLAREKGIPLERIMVSSDSNGSMPVFDADGELAGLTIATQESLLANIRHLLTQKLASIQEILGLFSANAACFYRFDHLGKIAVSSQADLILFNRDFDLVHVIARGRPMLENGRLLAQGTFKS